MGYYYRSGYYFAGYYLVEGRPRPEYLASFLPATIWTVANCCKLSRTYPGHWAYDGCRVDPVERRNAQTLLGLDDAALSDLRCWTEAALVAGHLSWPDVWRDLESPRDFHARYLQGVPHVRLMALGLPESNLNECLANLAVLGPGGARSGMYQALSGRSAPAEGGEVLGFDILGTEGWGVDCSFRCHPALVPLYRDQLHLTFNEHGFLATYGDAKRAADWNHSVGSGAEPVPWYPFLVVEYPLLRSVAGWCAALP